MAAARLDAIDYRFVWLIRRGPAPSAGLALAVHPLDEVLDRNGRGGGIGVVGMA
ncbi:hypothetical protein [Nocardia aurantiaca]|uniref:hypothetical protein n=1 Tax=Nocardia aurantiaca TaxID=2675850 RepID=UPI002E23E5DE